MLSNISCPTNVVVGEWFQVNYSYYGTPNPAPFEVRGLLADSNQRNCIYNESDSECVWNKASFDVKCPSPGSHTFNITCVASESADSGLCYFNEHAPLGCVVNCTILSYRNVTLIYNATTSEDKIDWCSVASYVWYDGGGLVSNLKCRNDDSELSCTDSNILKNSLNKITLLDLPSPQQYWWNVRCKATTKQSSEIYDIGDTNWTFTLN
jgi:hypothetical protein